MLSMGPIWGEGGLLTPRSPHRQAEPGLGRPSAALPEHSGGHAGRDEGWLNRVENQSSGLPGGHHVPGKAQITRTAWQPPSVFPKVI